MRESPYPSGDVIVEILACGVCGTDLKTYRFGHPMFQPPTILGHEAYGKVVEMKISIPGINLGDLVAIAPYVECGSCWRCLIGIPELCQNKTVISSGCFAQYVAMGELHAQKALFKVQSDAPQYVLVEPLACVLNGIEKLRDVGDVLIVGGGIMGTLFALTLRELGSQVQVVEISDWRKHFLKSREITALYPDELEREAQFTTIILTVNIPDIIEMYLAKIRDGGQLLLFAGYTKGTILKIYPYSLHDQQITLLGSFGYSSHHFSEALAMINQWKSSNSSLITHQYPLESGAQAISILEKGEAMKVVLRAN
ncbi:MAG: alcohol dehydrogenase catalytic domain-containing protein [Spirochaetota bacterium]